MARMVRSEFEGAWYHLMARGNRRESIFLEDGDRLSMLKTLGEACSRTGWEVHAWVLMDNHFHFVVHTPQPNLVVGMQWFMNTYTRRFNSRHKDWGRLFGDRYKALVIEPPEHGGEAAYLRSAIWYVHLNPVRAGLVRKTPEGEWNFRAHPWNSLLQVYGVAAKQRAEWARVEMGLSMEHLRDNASGRKGYEMEAFRRADEWEEALGQGNQRKVAESGTRGWMRGGERFRDELLDGLKERFRHGNRHDRTGEQAHGHGEKRAEQLVRLGCECFELGMEELRQLKGGVPRRVLIAVAIFEQTTVSQEWIASRLGMRSAANVSQQIRRHLRLAESKVPRTQLHHWLNRLRNE